MSPNEERRARFHAERAQLLWALDRGTEAATAFRSALERPSSAPGRRLIARRLAECESGTAPDEF